MSNASNSDETSASRQLSWPGRILSSRFGWLVPLLAFLLPILVALLLVKSKPIVPGFAYTLR